MKPPEPKGQLEIVDFSGHLSMYEAKRVRFRPAAYGLLVHAGAILMTRSRFTGLWDFPGGGVEAFEWMAEGLQREFYEETHVPVAVDRLVHVAEGYIAMFGHPFHSLRFYYACHLESQEIPRSAAHDPGEVTALKWWAIEEVPRDHMHPSDWDAFQRLTAHS